MGILDQLIDVTKKVNTEEQSQYNYAEMKALFLNYVKKDESGLRQQILKDFERGLPLTGKSGLRKRLGAIDLEYFGKAYFPHYFNRETPEFHRELDHMWMDGVLKNMLPVDMMATKKISRLKGCRRSTAAPRGHAKSTNVTFKDAAHATMYGYKHYIIIISDSSDQAEGFLENLRTEFEENEAIKEDFGDLQGKVWRSEVLLTTTDIKIEAIGCGKKIRGRKHRNWRPDLVILDDIENDENVNTPEQRKKLSNWFFKAVSKAGDDYTDIVYIGTLLHYDSLLANILKNPGYKSIKYKAVLHFSNRKDLWDKWEQIYIDLSNDNREFEALEYFEQNKAEMLEGTQVLWEAKLSYYDLMIMKVTEGEASFNSEEQNEPISPEDCLFQEDWLDYYNELQINFADPAFCFYGFVDPSLGKTKKSDTSAIITIAKNIKTGYMYIADADVTRRHPDVIINDCIEKEKWLRKSFGRGYTKFGAESNQFQWFMKEKLAEKSAEVGLYLPIEEVYQTSDKLLRIQSMQPDVKNKYIKFNKKHKTLLEQLKYFPMASHDDGPDALEGSTIAKAQTKLAIINISDLGL